MPEKFSKGGGRAQLVSELPDVADTSPGDIFILSEIDGDYAAGAFVYVGTEPTAATTGSLTKRAIVDSDFQSTGTPQSQSLNYVGAVSSIPATPADGTQNFFWDLTDGRTLQTVGGSGSSAVGQVFKLVHNDGNIYNVGFNRTWFDNLGEGHGDLNELIWLGDSALLNTSEGNISYGDDTLNTEALIIEFLDADEDAQLAVLAALEDGVDAAVLFEIVNDDLYEITAYTPGAAAGIQNVFLTAGGGGGLQVHDLWSGDIDGTANNWNAAGTTPVPDTAKWLLWNGGKASTGTDDGPAADWKWINAADWRDLTADTAGTTPGDDTGMLSVDWIATNIGDSTPDFARRDIIIGRTSDFIPLLLSTNSSEDLIEAQIKYVTFTEASDAEGTSVTANPDGTDGDPLKRVTIEEINYNIFNLLAHQGIVVDISEHNGGTPPSPSLTDRNVYYNRDNPVIYVPHREPRPDTQASATGTYIGGSNAGFRGSLYSPPATGAVGDFFWHRGSHTWEVRVGTAWTPVSFSELKLQAMSGGSLYFGADDVFFSEVTSIAVAAAILQNSGTYDAAKGYYMILSGNFAQIATFTAAVNNAYTPSYAVFRPGRDPVAYWYLLNQTEREPTTFPNPSPAIGSTPYTHRLRFSGTEPNERFFNWPFGDMWVPGSDVDGGNIDTGGGPALTSNHVVFQPDPGVWDIAVHFVVQDQVTTDIGELMLVEIMSGTDDSLIQTVAGYQNAGSTFGEDAGKTIIDLNAREIETNGSRQFYVVYAGAGTNVNDPSRGWIRLEHLRV